MSVFVLERRGTEGSVVEEEEAQKNGNLESRSNIGDVLEC